MEPFDLGLHSDFDLGSMEHCRLLMLCVPSLLGVLVSGFQEMAHNLVSTLLATCRLLGHIQSAQTLGAGMSWPKRPAVA